DAEVAKGLLRFALFKEDVAKPAKPTKPSRRQPKRVRTSDGDDEDEEDEEANESSADEAAPAQSDDGGLRPMQTAAAFAAISLNDAMDDDDDESMEVDARAAAGISASRLAQFKTQLSRAISDRRLDTSDSPWSFPDPFMSAINAGLDSSSVFLISEVEMALLEMQNDNRLMFRDNMIIMM
ncbi:hypothetical protein H4S02_012211, partial [Coemansia sp. RSA 2611]